VERVRSLSQRVGEIEGILVLINDIPPRQYPAIIGWLVAALIVHATEQIATRTGDAIGGLLNATFGNAPELIIALVALKAGYLDMVRASIIGAVLANLLLALGVASMRKDV